MEKNNVLSQVQEFALINEWGKVFKMCSEYLNEYEYDWGETEEEIALLKIKSVIKSIVLQDTFTGELNEENTPLVVREHAKLIDILNKSIDDISNYILTLDEGEAEQKFDSILSQVCRFAQEQYYNDLDYFIEAIGLDGRDDSVDNFITFQNGYISLDMTIKNKFIEKGCYIGDSIEIDSSVFDETMSMSRNKLFTKALEITNIINNSTDDFPYFSEFEVAYMYVRAVLLTDMSIPDCDEEFIDETIDIVKRLKHMANLCCDFLNAILVTQGERVSLCISEEERERQYNMMLNCVKKIREYESNYNPPSVNFEKFSTVPEKNSGGCYVATAVYGSYDCPQVWTLRRYRDYTLSETWYGRTFIKIYYVISPTIVKWFGHTEWFKKMWKNKLDSMVAKLQANGVESTPYEDKEWK